MAGFGDFGNVVGEWAAATGEQFNSEWHGAAPGEYEFRMWRQARNWKNGELERQAGEEAERLKKQLQEERHRELERLQNREDDFRRWGDIQIDRGSSAYDAYKDQTQQLRSLYDTYLGQSQTNFDAMESARDINQMRVDADRARRSQRQARVVGKQASYLDNLTQSFLGGANQTGGYFRDDLSDVMSRYSTGLSGYSGSDNVGAVEGASQELLQRYNREQQRKIAEYQQLRDTSLQQIGGASTQAQQGYNQFTGDLSGRIQNFQDPTAGLYADGTGLLSLASAFGSEYLNKLQAGQPQSQQAYGQQQQKFQDLSGRAVNPERGYAQNRDTELADNQRYGFLTQLYAPNFAGLQGDYMALNPLYQQASDIYQKTYGWNPERLAQFTDPLSQMNQRTSNSLYSQYSGMQQQLPGLTRGLESGLYSGSDLAGRQSRQNDVNQQLRSFEQSMTGMLSNFYNQYSNQVTQAKNEFNTQKSFRLREREQLGSQRQAKQADKRLGRARASAEQGRTTQLSRTAGLFDNNSLLSSLTRGN